MHVRVFLAGQEASWRFTDSSLLEGWLATRPWLARGGVKRVQLAAPVYAEEVIAAMRRTILAYDDGASSVVVQVVGRDEAEGGFTAAARNAFGIDAAPGTHAFLSQAASVLGLGPRVLLIEAPSNGPPGARFVDDAVGFADAIRKTRPGALLTALVVDTPQAALSSDAWDLTVGEPTVGVLERRRDGAGQKWGAYVHARLAWEVGGNLARAKRWDERGFGGIGIADDDALEALLNTEAQEEFSSLDNGLRLGLLEEFLKSEVERSVAAAARRKSAADLQREGMLWRPPGESWLRPVPFAARALLLAGRAKGSRELLRSCLVCAPLAHEILMRCFDLEAHLRASHGASISEQAPMPDTAERFRRFSARDPYSPRALYPKDCPAMPTEAWSFASFGEVLSALGSRASPGLRRLLELRNSVAHGHYVGWNAISRLADIERSVWD